MYFISCVNSYDEGHLGSFQLLAIIKKAAMNMVEHVSLFHVGASSRYMPRSGIAGSSGSTMSNFLRKHQTDFQSSFPILQSHQQWRSIPLSPHPLQYVLSRVFDFSNSEWCQMESQGCFDFLSLMTKEVEHYFRYFSAIQYSSVRILCLALYPISNKVI